MIHDRTAGGGIRFDRSPRRLLGIGGLVAMVAMAMAGLAPRTDARNESVTITDADYLPATVTVSVGETVTWVQDSNLLHTVTADGGSFASHDLGDRDTYGVVFDTPGTYLYHCKLHPMNGKVIVLTASTSPTASTTPSPTVTTPSSPAPSVGPSDGAAAPSIVSPPVDTGSAVTPVAIVGLIILVLVVLVLLLFVIPARRGPKADKPG